MALTPFATKEQMDQRTRGAITLSSHPFLETELKAASSLIRNHCGWHIAKQETLRLRQFRQRAEHIWLPAMEIESITKITVDGTEWDATPVSAVDFDRATGQTTLCARKVDIEFVAGFAEVPEDLITLTLQIAARALGSPLGLVREQAGTVAVTHSQSGFNIAGGDVLLEPEKAGLAAYKLGWVP